MRLEADLAAAVRPLPEPPPSLSARFDRAVLLTRHGAIGEPTAPLGLVAFTTGRPAAGVQSAKVLVVTQRALYVGGTDRARFEEIDPTRLASLDDGHTPLFVTADAEVPLRTLAAVLERLPAMPGRVAFAVALPADTRLPAPPELSVETAPICELPEAEDAGTASREALRAGLAPLIERAGLCAGTTEGPGALGGRVEISLRVGARGRVVDACVSADETDDGVLRACLLAAARELVLPVPSGGETYALAVPFAIAPGVSHRQLALCH